MTQKLHDGSYAPAYFGQAKNAGALIDFNDYSLRSGYIVAVYPPEDPNNSSKKNIEYDVACQVYNKNG
jgi:hypothetical protein